MPELEQKSRAPIGLPDEDDGRCSWCGFPSMTLIAVDPDDEEIALAIELAGALE